MGFLRRSLVIFIISLGAQWTLGASVQLGPEPHVLTFKRWKELQVNQAANRVVRIQNELTMAQKNHAKHSELVKLKAQQKNSQEIFEITKDFGIEDYFAVYLSQLGGSKSVLEEAAKGLSDEEVAELMRVFIESQNRSLKTSGSWPRPGATSRRLQRL